MTEGVTTSGYLQSGSMQAVTLMVSVCTPGESSVGAWNPMMILPTSSAVWYHVTDVIPSEVCLVLTSRKYRVCGDTVKVTSASAGLNRSHGSFDTFTELFAIETVGK